MYRKNTAGQFLGFAGVNASTGAAMAGTTGFAAYRVLDGGAQASATGTVTDRGNGQYSFALSQADTNGADCSILFAMTGMVPVEKTFLTTVLDPTSTAFGLVLAKTTNVTGFNDIAATAVVSNGAITTNGSGKVSGVVLADTVTTYTGNTPQTGDSFARLGTPAGASIAADIQTRAASAQIPANFTTATFASAGVFSTGALANAPTGGGSAQSGDAYALLNPLVSAGAFTGASLANVPKTGYSLNLSQAGLTVRDLGGVADASLTVGDALVAAIAAAAGKQSVSGTSYVVKTPSTGTTIRTFVLDSSTAPSSRT